MSLTDHPSTAATPKGVTWKWCVPCNRRDAAHVDDVCTMAASHPPAVGERVRFVGFNPRPWETTGTLTAKDGPIARVVWDSDPSAVGRPLHVSQIERLS